MNEFDHATPVTVSLRLQRGTAEVVAEERPNLQVDLTAEDGSDAAAHFTVTLDGDTLVVHAPEQTWNWRRTPKIRARIRVPLDSALAIRSAAADIRATGRWSTTTADVASADVHVDEVTGDASLKTASGSVSVNRVGGSLRISSASGDLRIGDVTRDVKMDTASGDITAHRIGGSLQADSASGDIQVGTISQGRARLSTASGDISVGVAVGTGVWLDLDTTSGSTTSDLAMGGGPAAPVSREAALELRIRTASGDIDVHRALEGVPAAA